MITVVVGTVADEQRGVPLAQLCRACGLTVEMVVAMVDEGILEPEGSRRGRWVFPPTSIHRARTVARLQRDLGLNMAGAALAVDLLDRIEKLHARLRMMDVARSLRNRRDETA